VTLVVMGIVWAMFAVDFTVNLVLAPRRGRYFITHLHEFLIVLLPALAPLRLL
jgi:voltage-gated potassium channel